jgi:hypothetical protein
MKQKDIMYLLLAVIIFLAAGFVGYTQLVPHAASSKVVDVEVVGPLPGVPGGEGTARLQSRDAGLDRLKDPDGVQDFGSPVDLSGLGNTAPFGQ